MGADFETGGFPPNLNQGGLVTAWVISQVPAHGIGMPKTKSE